MGDSTESEAYRMRYANVSNRIQGERSEQRPEKARGSTILSLDRASMVTELCLSESVTRGGTRAIPCEIM